MSTGVEAALQKPKVLLTFLRDTSAMALEQEMILPETAKALREHAEALEVWSSAKALFEHPPHGIAEEEESGT